MNKISLILVLFVATIGHAQITSTVPTFPKETDVITVTCDANEGNGALANASGTIYAHAGVITDKSTAPNDWKYVQGDWGTANAPEMTAIGGGKYTLEINNPRNFYSVPDGEKIEKLAFVFRDLSGNNVGRATGGGDIFIDIYGNVFSAGISSPSENNTIAINGTSIQLEAESSEAADLELFVNGQSVQSTSGKYITYTYSIGNAGDFEVTLVADNNGDKAYDTVNFVVNPTVVVEAIPSGWKNGINHLGNNKLGLVLVAPFKNHVYAVGDFSDWNLQTDYFMKKDPGGEKWWIEIDGLTADNYSFQYLVDGEIKIADPYSELVLDPWNDKWIPETSFKDIPAYPESKTTGIVSWVRMNAPVHNWTANDYEQPKATDLVIYEILVRDWAANRSFKTIMDSLDYLENLGINALQFMPVNEFEGNESWGYNPSFHMALDKYYGTPEDFKALIDECHRRDIAVIVDVVYNHAFSQSPLCQLYWDPVNFKPNSSNPFANPDAKHDFNVGYDLNHESPLFKEYLKQVMQYWYTEYNIDGMRFDLSKGFTQNNTLGNIGAWNSYDGSRVANLKRIYAESKEVNPNAYVILEHFANNDEERELANSGMFLWGNLNHEYTEAAMGYNSNFDWSSYKNRGWNSPKAIVFMESHDEERVMYKLKQFGGSNGSYNTKSQQTALERVAMCHLFLIGVPGPKMFWQFGETGYDFSIDYNGRVGNKPVKWDYFEDLDRKNLYDLMSQMNKLKANEDVFETSDFTLDVQGKGKRIHLNGNTKGIVLGNFDLKAFDMTPDFHETGWWYEYFTGDSMNVTDTKMSIYFEPGEYKLYTNKKLKDYSKATVSIPTHSLNDDVAMYPNPAADYIIMDLNSNSIVNASLIDISGKEVAVEIQKWSAGQTQIGLQNASSGLYLLTIIQQNGELITKKVIVNR